MQKKKICPENGEGELAPPPPPMSTALIKDAKSVQKTARNTCKKGILYSVRKVFLKISQNFQENTCVRVWF